MGICSIGNCSTPLPSSDNAIAFGRPYVPASSSCLRSASVAIDIYLTAISLAAIAVPGYPAGPLIFSSLMCDADTLDVPSLPYASTIPYTAALFPSSASV